MSVLARRIKRLEGKHRLPGIRDMSDEDLCLLFASRICGLSASQLKQLKEGTSAIETARERLAIALACGDAAAFHAGHLAVQHCLTLENFLPDTLFQKTLLEWQLDAARKQTILEINTASTRTS